MFMISLLKLPGVLMVSWLNWNFVFWIEILYMLLFQVTVFFDFTVDFGKLLYI